MSESAPLSGFQAAVGASQQSRVASWQRLLVLAAGKSHAFWIGVALLLVSPSLATGWVADDYLQLLALRPQSGIQGLTQRPWDLFRFASGDPHAARQLMEQGVFPWWADLHVRLAFFRPLSSLTHVLDAWLWPSSSVAMHAHNLFWFAALLVGVGLCYRTLTTSPLAAGLALALFAVDDVHAPVVGWISNRNMVIALALAAPGLLHHHRWCSTGARRSAWIAHGCIALGLAAGEAGLAIVCYLGAYALCLDTRPSWPRVRSLLGYLGVVLLWRIIYVIGSYGASGSGLYVDPAADPAAFAHVAGSRFLVLALALFGLPWSDLWELYPLLSPALQPAVLALSVALLLTLVLLAWPALRSRARARFWLVGCLASLMPLCATFPHDRLLLAPSIGAAALLAELIEHTVSADRPAHARSAMPFLLTVHALLAPIACGYRAAMVGQLDQLLRVQNATLPASPSVRGQTWALLNPPVDPFAAYVGPYRELHGLPRPRAFYWLATGVSELRVTTTDEHTLSIRPRDGFLWSSSQRMLRSSTSAPTTWAMPLELGEATFAVREWTRDGRPAEVSVRFKKSLRDASLSLMQWAGPGYVKFVPPEPGASVVVPAVDVISVLTGR